MRRIAQVLLLCLIAEAGLLAGPAAAEDTDAVAVNTKDGKSVFKLAFAVKKVTGDVDAQNAAVAYASCTDCRTVAASIQIVLVMNEPGDVTPENLALAINYQCTECETLAAAYQFVFGNGEEVTFTQEGKARLHELKKRFYDLKQREDLTLEELVAEIAAIAAEVAIVVDTEIVLKHKVKEDEATTATTSGPHTTSAPVSSTTVSGPSTTQTLPSTTTTISQATSTTDASPTTSS